MGALALVMAVAACSGTNLRGEVDGEVPDVDQAVFAAGEGAGEGATTWSRSWSVFP